MWFSLGSCCAYFVVLENSLKNTLGSDALESDEWAKCLKSLVETGKTAEANNKKTSQGH